VELAGVRGDGRGGAKPAEGEVAQGRVNGDSAGGDRRESGAALAGGGKESLTSVDCALERPEK
jgi:hypothetical protein